MRSWTRPLVSMVVVGALLAVGASCTSDDSITGPSSEQSSQPNAQPSQGPTPDPLLGSLVDPVLQTVLGTVNLLTCSPQPYAQTRAVVGRLQPAGLKFAKPATLTLSYSNCLLPPLVMRVVYTDEQLRVLELIPSLDLRLTRSVSGSIRHFSRYAVAY